MGDEMIVKEQIFTEEALYYSVGNQIKRYRQKSCMTQEVLAEKIGVDQRYMSMIENGKSKTSLGTYLRISRVLNIPIQALLKDISIFSQHNDIENAIYYLSTLTEEKLEFALSFLEKLSGL